MFSHDVTILESTSSWLAADRTPPAFVLWFRLLFITRSCSVDGVGWGCVGGSVRRRRSCHVDRVGWGEVGYKRHVHSASNTPCASSSNF